MSADLGADFGDGLGDEVGGVPVAGAAADLVDEVAEQVESVGGVDDLGVELDAVAVGVVAHGGDGDAVGAGERAEAVGHLVDAVAVRHPDGHRSGQVGEQRRFVAGVDVGGAEFALAAGLDASAELVGHGLHAVADAEHRHSAVEGPVGRGGRGVVVDAGGSAAEDDALGIEFADALPGGGGRDEFAVDVEFAHAAGDQHRGLRAEVDDDDGLVLGVSRLRVVHVIMISAEYAEAVSHGELEQAVEHLRRSGVVALPTDTQYALSGVANDDLAVAAVFRLKRRPGGENLPVFLPPSRWREHLAAMAEPLDERVLALAESAWPGAVTLIVNKRAEWSTRAVDGGTIALRIPDHPVAATVLDLLDAPLTGTSANIHGEPASLTADDVRRQFDGAGSVGGHSESLHILGEGGVLPAGTASTILDCTGRMPRVLRRGPMLSAKVGELLMRHWGLSDIDAAS